MKSVLFFIQVYWSQIFFLPKKLVQAIKKNCRTFIWTGGVEVSKNALLAWDKPCISKTTGGVNFLNISSWNKATLCKLLWTLSHKKDKLWIKWVHMYYVKGETLWEANTKQASWLIKKIFKATEYVEAAGYTEDQFQRLHYFSVKKRCTNWCKRCFQK